VRCKAGHLDAHGHAHTLAKRNGLSITQGRQEVQQARRTVSRSSTDGLLVGIVAGVFALLFNASSNIMVTGLFSGVLMFAYFVAMEVTQGRTVGKMLLGLSVHGPGGAH
jgi:hypothetical protein